MNTHRPFQAKVYLNKALTSYCKPQIYVPGKLAQSFRHALFPIETSEGHGMGWGPSYHFMSGNFLIVLVVNIAEQMNLRQ